MAVVAGDIFAGILSREWRCKLKIDLQLKVEVLGQHCKVVGFILNSKIHLLCPNMYIIVIK